MDGCYGLYDDGRYDKLKGDNKNSRRKMDKPRKRKKDSEAEQEGDVSLSSTVEQASNSLNLLNEDGAEPSASPVLKEAVSVITQSHAAPPASPKVCSPLPEDLSVRQAPSPMAAQSPPTHPAMTSSTHDWVAPPSGRAPESSSTVGGSSVRDLEEAMNKHLPTASSGAGTMEEVEPYGRMSDYKSTIQWIGSNDALPATNLLRSLYASRETVIRPNIYNPRPQYYDVQSTLLTPPGGDPYAAGKAVPASSSYGGMMGYSSSPISVACMPSSNNNNMDTYSMTPPASVSPQEKYVYGGSGALDSVDAHGGHLRYDGSSVPIKPHAYPLPAHANMAAYERSAAAQYPTSGYYGATGFSYNASSAHYRDGSKTGNVW